MEFCCSGILNSLDFSIKEDIISLGIIIIDLSELAIKVFSKDLLLNKEVSVFFILSNVLVFNKALVVEILFSFLLSLLKSFKLDIPNCNILSKACEYCSLVKPLKLLSPNKISLNKLKLCLYSS